MAMKLIYNPYLKGEHTCVSHNAFGEGSQAQLDADKIEYEELGREIAALRVVTDGEPDVEALTAMIAKALRKEGLLLQAMITGEEA